MTNDRRLRVSSPNYRKTVDFDEYDLQMELMLDDIESYLLTQRVFLRSLRTSVSRLERLYGWLANAASRMEKYSGHQ